MIEPKPEIVEDDSQESSFDKRKYIIIYSSIFFLAPTAIGVPLTITLRNGTYIESLYVIFGVISLLIGVIRSWNRDSKNVRKNHTIVEDKDTPQYKAYRFQQMTSYIVGFILLAVSVAAFYICEAAGVYNPF